VLAQVVSRGDSPGDRPTPSRHGGALRIGYVSAHFDLANYMKPVWGAVNQHDREHFCLEFFSDAAGNPQAAGYAPDPRDQWHHVQGMSNGALVELIRGRGLDVIVDLNAYSYVSRLGIWLAPLAHANVAWFNMYATSGLPGFDYLVGDPIVYRPDEAPLFSERVHVLPCSYLTFSSLYPTPEVAPPPCQKLGYFTLGCLAPQYKITGETLAVWAELLRRLPTSRLLVRNRLLGRPNNREYVRMRMQDAGLPMERVELLGPAAHHEFLATYNRIDLALDTFPYNGGSTTMESLVQGVPVACFTGDRWAARISASLMHFAGLDEFVAANQAEHVEQVVRLVQDPGAPERLSALRAGMRERLSRSSVCDSLNLARELERFYRKISG
jgi:protein O-GlcNAc transferase